MLSKNRLKELLKLKTKKGRKNQNKFLIEGWRLGEEAAKSDWTCELVLFTDSFEKKSPGEKLLTFFKKKNVELVKVKDDIIKWLSDTVTAQGFVAVMKVKDYSTEGLWSQSTLLALDSVREPGNVGTLIRTADAFDFKGILLSKECVDLYNPKVVRSTMGSLFHILIINQINLKKIIPELKEKNFRIIGTQTTQGEDLSQLDYSQKLCVLIGGESEGLDPKFLQISDQIARIPMYGKAESLNASVAGGIIMYEIAKQKRRFSL